MKLEIRGAFCLTAHRACGCGGVHAELDAALHELLSAVCVHHDEHNIGRLTAQLQPESPTSYREHGRRAPASVPAPAANERSPPETATHSQRKLHLGGNNTDTYRLLSSRSCGIALSGVLMISCTIVAAFCRRSASLV